MRRSLPFLPLVPSLLLALSLHAQGSRDAAASPVDRRPATAGSVAAERPGEIDPAVVDRFVEAYRARTGLPGAVVAITRGDRVVHVAGYGHAGDGTPLTARSPLPIASLSKSVAALAVMQLVEAGRVELDAPVRRYLPEFRLADPRASRITVRQLLDQTSGMADTEFREKSVTPPASLREAVALLRAARLASEPGTAFHYHNPNYWVAARLVEVVGGEPYAEYLRRHVFAPAGMEASTTVGSLREAPAVARGHVRFFGRSIALPEPAWYLQGASGVVTTAGDLARWLIVQGDGGVAAGGARLVSARSVGEMHDAQLGWRTGEEPGEVQHGGILFTFTARQLLLPRSGYGIAVVTNRGLNLGPDDAYEITRGLAALVEGGSPEPGPPVGYVVDAVLALLIVATLALGARSLRRGRGGGRGGGRVPAVAAVLAWTLPVVALAGLRATTVLAAGGRDLTWLQLLYVAPGLVAWLAVAAALGVAVVARRVRLLREGGCSAADSVVFFDAGRTVHP